LARALITKIFTRLIFDCSVEETAMNNKERLSAIELKFAGSAEDRFIKAMKKQMEMHEGVTFVDLLKFLYQSTLGPFHLLEMMNKTELKEWIRKNLASTKPSEGPLTEELYSKKWVRVNFGPYKRQYGNDYQRIYEAMISAETIKHGELKEYTDLLKKLVDAIKRKKIRPLTEEPTFLSLVETFLKEYDEEGFPSIHHSHMYMERNSCDYLVVPHSVLRR
jgi:hypothetical protein